MERLKELGRGLEPAIHDLPEPLPVRAGREIKLSLKPFLPQHILGDHVANTAARIQNHRGSTIKFSLFTLAPGSRSMADSPPLRDLGHQIKNHLSIRAGATGRANRLDTRQI